jgi:hypothetical protein
VIYAERADLAPRAEIAPAPAAGTGAAIAVAVTKGWAVAERGPIGSLTALRPVAECRPIGSLDSLRPVANGSAARPHVAITPLH